MLIALYDYMYTVLQRVCMFESQAPLQPLADNLEATDMTLHPTAFWWI